MYSPRVDPDLVQRLYQLKNLIKTTGEKTDMIKLVREALERYIPEKEREIREKFNQSGESIDKAIIIGQTNGESGDKEN